MKKSRNNFIKKIILSISLTVSLLAAPVDSLGQALTQMRDWTSTDGKLIRAELLVFESGEKSETVRLRLKGGSIVKLDLSRFKREDQAIILKERLSSQFRMDFNKDKDSCFFYSKHLGKDDWHNRTWAYIGSDTKDSWLRLSIYSKLDFFSKGNAIIVVGKGAPVRIEYNQDDVDRSNGRRDSYEGVDVLLTKQRDAFLTALQREDRLLFFLEPSEGDLIPIPLSKEEKDGIRATGRAFQTVSTLTNDQTWWATLIGKDPAEFRAAEADPLKAWRNPDQTPLIPMKTWTDALGKTKQAEILGFDREKVVMRDAEKKLSVMDTINFKTSDLELLTSKRLENSLYQSWHPIDDRHLYYWPISWKSDRRFRQQVVLLAFESNTQKPRLVLQHLFAGTPELTPVSSELHDSETITGPKIGLEKSVKLRGSSGVKVWMPLDKAITTVLLDFSRKAQTFDYLLGSTEGEKQAGKMSDDEYKASIESIEIYRMIERLNTLLVKPKSEPSESKKPETSE